MKLCFLCPEVITELDELERRVERLSDLGYQGIELPACHPLPYPMEDLEARVRRVQLPIIALTSAWSYRHEGLSLVARDDVLRGRAVGRLIEYARLAARLGAVLIVGLIRGAPGDEPDARAAKNRIEDGLARLARAAEECGARVAVEPINHLCVGHLHTPEEVRETLTRIGSPSLGLALDTLHLHIETPSVPDALRAHARAAWTIHLAESNGGPFGTGAIDFLACRNALSASGYDRHVSVKVYRHADWDEAATRSIARLRDQGWPQA
jgi:sugar phosphate isomerase/epimerase